ncbi:MAG TPA: carbohydrate ABC transporter permease [Streptosporangiaceae bacterium]|jgi:multiple sugar transport system permease protein
MLSDPVWFRWVRRVFLTLLAVFTLVPIYVMVTTGLKSLSDVNGDFTWLPNLNVSAFVDMWSTIPLGRYFLNSVIVCTTAAVLSVLVAMLAAYALSRYRFPGRGVFSTTVLSTQMFPGILFLLPLFLIFVNIDNTLGFSLFFGTRFGLILTYLTFTLPFAIWMLTAYFDSIPRDLDQAAMVDGAGPLGALFRVVVPTALPGIVAVTVYAFMTAWSEVLFASVMTTPASRTLAIGLQEYSTSTNVYWNQLMAASFVVSIPVVALFLLLQRYLVQGLTAGAVK